MFSRHPNARWSHRLTLFEMAIISNVLKKIVFWNYERTSWQWDVLCVLILVFIFLTPKSWFANTAYQRSHPRTIVIEVVAGQPDRAEAERRAKHVAGRPDGTVSDIRPIFEAGKLVRYEVDIR